MQEGVEPVKLPLQVILPLASVIIGAGLAIGIGLTFLEVAGAFSHTEPVIVGAVLTAGIMLVAGLLSSRYPNPKDQSDH